MFLSKLTFVGHSLGGIIVREALKHLSAFRNKMHAYISLGSPHLGYMYNSSSLVDAGMWLIKKWKKSDSLKQLSMTDMPRREDSYLYKLSEDDNLKYFKYVMLVSSF
jgi:triacylglycerol esterase/lipase EstA (alpha/beta hydrolase family)